MLCYCCVYFNTEGTDWRSWFLNNDGNSGKDSNGNIKEVHSGYYSAGSYADDLRRYQRFPVESITLAKIHRS